MEKLGPLRGDVKSQIKKHKDGVRVVTDRSPYTWYVRVPYMICRVLNNFFVVQMGGFYFLNYFSTWTNKQAYFSMEIELNPDVVELDL